MTQVRCFDDGRLALDNNSAERALRGVAVGRNNYLFAGSDRGGERAAAMYSLIETAKLNRLDPEAYLRDVLARIADHPNNRNPRRTDPTVTITPLDPPPVPYQCTWSLRSRAERTICRRLTDRSVS